MLNAIESDSDIITSMEIFRRNVALAYTAFSHIEFDGIIKNYSPKYNGDYADQLQRHMHRVYAAAELSAMRTITYAMDVTVNGHAHSSSISRQYLFDAFIESNMNEVGFVQYCILRATQSVVSSLLWRLPSGLLRSGSLFYTTFGCCLSEEVSRICSKLRNTDVTKDDFIIGPDYTDMTMDSFENLCTDPVAICIKCIENAIALDSSQNAPLRCKHVAETSAPIIEKRIAAFPPIELCFIPQIIFENCR